ncbi:MAG: type II toxin-antitoxin system prevent-host-death family antitoxin [Patescibacteria group bacterium]
MITANVHDAKTNLSKLLAKVAEGERVVITNRGTPVAELTKPSNNTKPLSALLGALKDEIEVPDNFEWTDEEIEELFYGPIEPKE